MNRYITPTWGYKIVSDREISFYHILLEKIPVRELYQVVKDASGIKKQPDGSIMIFIQEASTPETVVHQVRTYLEQRGQALLETNNYYYVIDEVTQRVLKEWALTVEGAIALLLVHDKKLAPLLSGEWELINSPIGGLYLAPYTLIFYEDHPKILHPIAIGNMEDRKHIEIAAASYIRKIVKRVKEAQKGQEGLALVSLLEEKTMLSIQEIASTINRKARNVMTPKRSPLFSH